MDNSSIENSKKLTSLTSSSLSSSSSSSSLSSLSLNDSDNELENTQNAGMLNRETEDETETKKEFDALQANLMECLACSTPNDASSPKVNFSRVKQNLTILAQKNFLNRLICSRKMRRLLLDDTIERIFNNIYYFIKLFHAGSKRESRKIMKLLLQVNFQLIILSSNNIYSDLEWVWIHAFQERFHEVALFCANFESTQTKAQNQSMEEIEKLVVMIEDCFELLFKITQQHFSSSSKKQLISVKIFFTKKEFLQCLLCCDATAAATPTICANSHSSVSNTHTSDHRFPIEVHRELRDDVQRLLDRDFI